MVSGAVDLDGKSEHRAIADQDRCAVELARWCLEDGFPMTAAEEVAVSCTVTKLALANRGISEAMVLLPMVKRMTSSLV
jgi:hypothetical protein